ncbi:Predicted thioesterase [Prochlorococcus marinus str. MIT 9515]|uniref:1,4-dihydroxy-2-naphthoyl-CoA hydrolase n=1 Tax=Prochlorococcus marinus (strain MIT 9515) TaxID=167542 RepID=DNCH_PROM5|nr:thioesterase family protein [Prochlorococcus marinus]A2BUF0.1 RecName: Full=1,4-dihydroxy-2-naphthoyl-CoA hydrolase; Short=DHNA-CoA hydrolase; AltName: Full=DHNA-CoA thioesterase [Prochlorococcus marinus str. MIT 9515]ABM71411.1 Predicted thioesterase [Prochlorococcus marinus str. MIT 9515]
MNPHSWLILKRKVRFGDCDSAGVIHFHNLLRWAHESWEESIDIYGISHQVIFPSCHSHENQNILPIVNCEANFLLPIKLGDLLTVKIFPKKISNHLFQVNTLFLKDEIKVAEGKIIHCSLDMNSKLKVKLPDQLERWIEASNINTHLKEC